eukprot:scaffold260748_cov31-Tisochrysis_lutea.AAC.2
MGGSLDDLESTFERIRDLQRELSLRVFMRSDPAGQASRGNRGLDLAHVDERDDSRGGRRLDTRRRQAPRSQKLTGCGESSVCHKFRYDRNLRNRTYLLAVAPLVSASGRVRGARPPPSPLRPRPLLVPARASPLRDSDPRDE